MMAVYKSFPVLAGTALMAAGPVDLPERHTEMIIRNHTDTDHSLRSTPPAEAGALVVRTTLAAGSLPAVARVPDGRAEVIDLPARSTVVIDCRDAGGVTWRTFRCLPAGGDAAQAGPVRYRVGADGERRVHADGTWWGLEQTGANTITLRTPDPLTVLLFGPGCAIL